MSVRVAVVGAGYWGINHVRAFSRLANCTLVAVCDANEKALSRAHGLAPSARLEMNHRAVLDAIDVDAVVLATPAVTHAPLALEALAAGKHVFVEKPLALSEADAERVVAAAAQAGRTLMVGHLMLYHPGYEKLRALVRGGEIGEIYYAYALRVNLGRLRTDENAL